MSAQPPFGLFEVCGVEIEYMVIDRASKNVRSLVEPVLDRLEADNDGSGAFTGEIEWSNELVAHVAEAKCRVPVPEAAAMLHPLCKAVARVNEILDPLDACLMPSAAHPWMDPAADAMLWPKDPEGIYAEYDRIFGCNTHGWTNLQSVHINLPFADAEEFGRLHAAIRVVLPLIPALAAASPYLDGAFTGLMDARMEEYRINSLKIPSMTGRVIPEPVFTPAEYRTEILERIYRETEPFDPKGILHDEWANARGAIARFDRNAIEIRVIDSQECPTADLGIVHAVTQLVRLLVEERFVSQKELRQWDTEKLRELLFCAVRNAEQEIVAEPEYLALFGLSGKKTFHDVWGYLLELPELRHPLFDDFYRRYLNYGPLARRLTARYGLKPERKKLAEMIEALCACLKSNELF